MPSTPLACMLQGFDSYFSNPSYPKGTRARLKFFCEQVWPKLGTGWPPQGSFKSETTDALWDLIAGNISQYPDQFPYIDQWANVLVEKAEDLLQCQAEMIRLCVARPGGNRARVMAKQGKQAQCRQKYGKKKRILPAVPEDKLWPSPPPCAPPLPPALPARAEAARAEEAKSDLLAPLRQVNQPIMNQQGEVEYWPLFQYVPFTTTDLLNWKQHYGPLSTKPTEMADLFQTIMRTHDPTWSDVQQLMNALLTPEEKEKWKVAMRKCVKARFPNVDDITAELAEKAPERDPGWEPTRDDDWTRLREYQNLVVEAMRGAGKPPVNMSKPSLVTQRADESPESFLQQLIKAYELYTQVDPRLPDNVRMLNERFIVQSYEDIWKKLHELLEIARKVYVNRDKVEKKEKDARMQKKTELLAVALQEGMALGPPNRGPRLGPNQCAYCKGEGHWSRECPKKIMHGGGLIRQAAVRSGLGVREERTQERFPRQEGGEEGAVLARGISTMVVLAGVPGQTPGPRCREMMGLAEAGWSD
uniref:CCHC-type domain-containing protein n=1 Tax=Naja naja TaxID=35670 RepID=A0A8C6XFQ5_NAJNA